MTKKLVPPPIPAPRVTVPAMTQSSVDEPTGNTGQPIRDEKGRLQPGHPYAWKPGQSGNPAGRPRSSTEMKQMAASYTDLALSVKAMTLEIQRLRLEKALDVIRNAKIHTLDEVILATSVIDSPQAMAAVNAMLDRGHGKPQQKVELDVNNAFDRMSDEELEQWVISNGAEVVAGIAAKRKAK